MPMNLAEFTVALSGTDYLITLETEDGERVEAIATYDQLDLIVDAIDQQLDKDEEVALKVEGEDEPA